jgi:ankyrin repeat protein
MGWAISKNSWFDSCRCYFRPSEPLYSRRILGFMNFNHRLTMKRLLMVFLVVCVSGLICLLAFSDSNPAAAQTPAKPSDDTIREFHNAISVGDSRLAEKMLKSYPDLVSLELPDPDPANQIAPMLTAIEHGQAHMAILLINHGASHDVGKPGATPMFRAAILGHTDIVNLLLDDGADINGGTDPANVADVTPLRGALCCAKRDTALAMVQAGARIDIFSAAGLGWNGWVTKQIQQHPEQANMTDNWNFKPITMAVAGGCAGTAEILLSHGADVNEASPIDGGVYLHIAAMYGYSDLMMVLLAHGATVNARKTTGQTPLDYADKYKQQDTAQLLRDHGAKHGSEL